MFHYTLVLCSWKFIVLCCEALLLRLLCCYAFSSKWNPKMMVTYSRNNFSFPEEKQTRKKVPEKYLEPSMLDHLCYKKWCEWDSFSIKLISSVVVFIAMHIKYTKPTIMEVSSWQKNNALNNVLLTRVVSLLIIMSLSHMTLLVHFNKYKNKMF